MSTQSKTELVKANTEAVNNLNETLHEVVEDILDDYVSQMGDKDEVKEIPSLDDKARESIHAHIRGLIAQQGISIDADHTDRNLAQKGAYLTGQTFGVIGGIVAQSLSYLPLSSSFGAGFHNGYGVARHVERQLVAKATKKCKFWGKEVKDKVNKTLPTREKAPVDASLQGAAL